MALRPVLFRSVLVPAVLISLAVPLVVGAPPAGAAPAATTTRTAVASWVGTGPGAPGVSLQVIEQSGPFSSNISFLASENYCDTTSNTAVFLSYFASGPTTNVLFTVAPNLGTAVLIAPRLSVNFTEKTAPECNTNGSDLATVVSGPRNIALLGLWRAAGPATPGFPGEVVRPASAALFASAPPPLRLTNLGTPTFAQISQYTAPQ